MRTSPQFRRWLANQLERHHLTDLALAGMMGVSHVTVGRWKRGTRPRDEHLIQLAHIFNVDLIEVYTQLGVISLKNVDLPADVREIVRKLLTLTPDQREAFDAILASMMGALRRQEPEQPPASDA